MIGIGVAICMCAVMIGILISILTSDSIGSDNGKGCE